MFWSFVEPDCLLLFCGFCQVWVLSSFGVIGVFEGLQTLLDGLSKSAVIIVGVVAALAVVHGGACGGVLGNTSRFARLVLICRRSLVSWM